MASVDQKRRKAASRGHEAAGRPCAQDSAGLPEIVPAPYCRWKRALDLLIAVLVLVPCLPLLLLLAWRPGIFRQVRVGKDGRRFIMYKIRTMRDDAEAATGAVWAKKHDPRVGRFGRILRRAHLDELPQLLNVLRGEMSLVGPRPERPEFVRVLAKNIPGYRRRLAVFPGITGLAQVNLPPDSNLDSVRRKLSLDLEYIERAGLVLDLRLLFCTFLRLLWIPGVRVLGLHREVILPAAPSPPPAGYVSPACVANLAAGRSGSAVGNDARDDSSGHDTAARRTKSKPR